MAEVGLLSFQMTEIVNAIAIVVVAFTSVAVTWYFFR